MPALENYKMSSKISDLKKAIIEGDQNTTRQLAEELLEEGVDPMKTIEDCVYPAVGIVGEKFEKGEYFLTELMLSAEAMNTAVNVFVKGITDEKSQKSLGKNGIILLGTVNGDVHEIGKNLVATMLRVNGFSVHDAGKDVSPSEFLEQAEAVNADIIGLSALMTNTMQNQREVIDYLKKKSKKTYKVIVGGAPTSNDWAIKIGANGWAPDAPSAVSLAKKVLGIN